MDAVVDLTSWEIPNVFRVLRDAGHVEAAEMYRAFNMGVGMVVIAPPDAADAVMRAAKAANDRAWVMGHVAAGSGRVRLT
jgi:phosphoribosylformylglycinamidine cyclo-ligase